MLEEGDLIIFVIGALVGAIAGYWIRDRQSLRQKMRFNKKHGGTRSPPEHSQPPDR
jgi:hypothetical protein